MVSPRKRQEPPLKGYEDENAREKIGNPEQNPLFYYHLNKFIVVFQTNA